MNEKLKSRLSVKENHNIQEKNESYTSGRNYGFLKKQTPKVFKSLHYSDRPLGPIFHSQNNTFIPNNQAYLYNSQVNHQTPSNFNYNPMQQIQHNVNFKTPVFEPNPNQYKIAVLKPLSTQQFLQNNPDQYKIPNLNKSPSTIKSNPIDLIPKDNSNSTQNLFKEFINDDFSNEDSNMDNNKIEWNHKEEGNNIQNEIKLNLGYGSTGYINRVNSPLKQPSSSTLFDFDNLFGSSSPRENSDLF